MSNLYKILQKLNLQCNKFLYIFRFVVQLPTFQCITTAVSDNNKQYRYISALLLWSQIVLVCCFSGKCLMHRTVPVECWRESYCSLILVENINCYVCDWSEEIPFPYVADSIQQLDYVCICFRIILKWTLKKWRLWLAESIRSMFNLKITVIKHDIWQKKKNILSSWSSSVRPLCTHTVWYRLFVFSFATRTAHRCT